MPYTTLKGFDNIGEKSSSEIISDNLISFFDWGFIDKGGYFNVEIPTSGAYGGYFHNLKNVVDGDYVNGQVWETPRQNWIWESGTSINTPISISGVYVNNAFYPSNTEGPYKHYYDYRNGRVVFSSAISTSSQVQLEYSYKWINVVDVDTIPFFSRLHNTSFRPDSTYFSQSGSGDWNVLGKNRIQLPTVAIEVVPINNIKGYSIGTGARYTNNIVLLHILNDDSSVSKRLADYIVDQTDKTIYLFDSNEIAASNDFPLDYRNMVKYGAKTYPRLVDENANGGYRWKKLRFIEGEAERTQRIYDTLFLTTVRMETEVVLTAL